MTHHLTVDLLHTAVDQAKDVLVILIRMFVILRVVIAIVHHLVIV
jgi:hypothetical protein